MALRALHTYYHLRAFAATSLRVATCNASPEAFVTFRTSRPFHTSFLTLAEDNKDSETVAAAVADVKSDTTLEASDAATEPPKTSRRRRRFMEWMNGEGAKFKKPAMGTTNYLAGRTPFPMNPLFSPNPPVTDSLREQIYENYMYDSALPTPRMLGAKFKLSIRRIEAILRLKAHEKALVEQVCYE
ncbi:hypothetical protein BC938DRAFT_483839 [Jimgerdemannia flammicorona]|uniref:Uncharacterized protein n=1 Tax=Jimgerdemannia flammicorona TaxID=994334 RepID=A0A433QBA3_9FUNG|nr:hypothetical protein BC938DRAFT_483839 [Jimgerdemannia flammicorona]